jgi:hypothetical protein
VPVLQAELDELVGADCLLCGQVMIDSVALPLGAGAAEDHLWAL